MRTGTLFLCALLLWGSAIFLRAPQRQQELRVLITARNMVETGNPLHFEFQNQPRYRKPPLAYWVAGAGFALTNQLTSAWAGRLFFLAAALGGLVLFRFLAGERAALLFLFTYGSLVYAPLAETDFLQLTGLILAFRGWQRSNGWFSGLGMAMAVLSKGPGGVAIPLLCFLILLRSHPRSLRFWLPAVLVPLIAGGGWILYLQFDPVASAALAADLSATFLDTAHRNPLPYYVWTLPLVMFPVVLLAIRAPCFVTPIISTIGAFFHRPGRQPRNRCTPETENSEGAAFVQSNPSAQIPLLQSSKNSSTESQPGLSPRPVKERTEGAPIGNSSEKTVALTWFWVTFALLTLTVSKQRHYALMLLPPACWWLSLHLRSGEWLEGLAGIRTRKTVLLVTAVICVIQVAISFFSQDAANARFLQKAQGMIQDSETVHVVGINSAKFDFHLGRHVENTDSVQHAYDRAAPGDAIVVVENTASEQKPEMKVPPILKENDSEWIRRMYTKP